MIKQPRKQQWNGLGSNEVKRDVIISSGGLNQKLYEMQYRASKMELSL